MEDYVEAKLREVFDNTLDSDMKFEGKIESPDFYKLVCNAASKDQLFKLMGNNMCMFNCEYDNKDAVMILFSIPINTEETVGAKNVAERVMEVVTNVEQCFTTIDYIKSVEIKEDKFVYVTLIKIINGKGE
jgi:hypothetical protein